MRIVWKLLENVIAKEIVTTQDSSNCYGKENYFIKMNLVMRENVTELSGVLRYDRWSVHN